jgi:hypothetical protein
MPGVGLEPTCPRGPPILSRLRITDSATRACLMGQSKGVGDTVRNRLQAPVKGSGCQLHFAFIWRN